MANNDRMTHDNPYVRNEVYTRDSGGAGMVAGWIVLGLIVLGVLYWMGSLYWATPSTTISPPSPSVMEPLPEPAPPAPAPTPLIPAQ